MLGNAPAEVARVNSFTPVCFATTSDEEVVK